MKKRFMVLLAALAMMLAIGGPASAAAVGGDVTFKFWDASQSQAAAATQAQHGDATAAAASSAGNFSSAADADASAAISQSLTIEQRQWNGGF